MSEPINSEPKKVIRKVIKKVVRKTSDSAIVIDGNNQIVQAPKLNSNNINVKTEPKAQVRNVSAAPQSIKSSIQNKSELNGKEKKRSQPLPKAPPKKSKLFLIIGVFAFLIIGGGVSFLFINGKNINGSVSKESSSSGLSIIKSILPVGNAALILPSVETKSNGAPIWVHLVHSGGGDEALKNGPSKSLNAYKELKAVSPFVLYTPVPPKGGWLAEGAIAIVAKEVIKIINEKKCDANRLVISGEGVGTTAALLLTAELDGKVGAVLGLGSPSEEAFVAIDKFRYAPIRLLVSANDKDAVGWAQKIAGDLRASGCAVTVSEISPSPDLIGGAWGAPELWAWMATRRVADSNTRAGIDSLLAWSAPKPPTSAPLTAKPIAIDESQTVKNQILGEYFDGTAFNKKILERMDKSINIPDLGYQLPSNKVENLSIRWTGLIKIEKEGVYTFYSSSDDGQKVLIGGVTVIDDWADHGVTEKTGAIKLAVGWYNVVVEHYQGIGGGSISVSWQGPGFGKKIFGDDNVYTLKQNQGKQ